MDSEDRLALLDRLFDRMTKEARRQVVIGGPRFVIQHNGTFISVPTDSGLDELHLRFIGNALNCSLSDHSASAPPDQTLIFTVAATVSDDVWQFELDQESVNIDRLNGRYRPLLEAINSEIGNVLTSAFSICLLRHQYRELATN